MAREGQGAFNDEVRVLLTPIAGWTHVYNVNADIVNTTLVASGVVTHSDTMAEVNSGAATNSSALIETTRIARYIAGMGNHVRFTGVFDPPVEGNDQKVGVHNAVDELAVGYDDLEFGIWYNGVHTPLSQCNGIIPDFDYTNGNVFFVQWQWLGFGAIRWGYEVAKGVFEVLHTLEYPNTEPIPSLSNPSMRGFMSSTNTTNATNVMVKSPSLMIFREGAVKGSDFDPLRFGRAFDTTETVTAEEPVLAIRPKATYQSVANLLTPLIGKVAFSTDGTKNVTFRLYRGVGLTAASWSDYDTNVSSLEYDESATAFSGGRFLFAYELGKEDASHDEVGQWGIELEPNEVFLITAESANSSIVKASILAEEGF